MHVLAIHTASDDDVSETTAWASMNLGSASRDCWERVQT